jgi:hypothetical protein
MKVAFKLISNDTYFYCYWRILYVGVGLELSKILY